MSATGQETRRSGDTKPDRRIPTPTSKPGIRKGIEQMKMPPGKTWLWFMVILLTNFFFVKMLMPGETPVTVPYTVFKEEVRKGNVEAIYGRADTITGRFASPVTYPPAGGQHSSSGKDSQSSGTRGAAPRGVPSKTATTFETTLPSFADPGLEKFLIDNHVEISAEPIQDGGNPWATLFFSFGPALFFIGFYIWMFRRAAQGGGMGGGLMGIGKSTARRYDQEKDSKVTFDDVAGIDEAENELVEIVDFLKDTKKYTRLGGTAPKGVLLVGAPGTGKTLLAKAVAGEAGVPFFSMGAASSWK